ncbi:MAG: amidohydrolase family protein [Planctomycetes bacterium]|nr:amidohydrolase family protein [Planctomycetota bacterium]
MTDHSTLPLIDAHTHMRAIGSVANQSNVMDACHLTAVNALSMAARGGMNINQNVLVALFKAERPGRVYGFGGLHHEAPAVDPLRPDFAGQLRRLRDLGFDGVKMIEGKPSVYKPLATPLNDPLYDEFYGLLEAWRMPVLLHVGDPAGMWDTVNPPAWAVQRGWVYGDGTYPTLEELYAQVTDVLDRHPSLRLILAHFAFLDGDRDRCAVMFDRWSGLAFDLTPGWGMYGSFSKDPAAWRDFFIRYADRILFGTDNSGGRTPNDPEKVDTGSKRIAAMRRCLELTGEVEGFAGGSRYRGLGLPSDVLAMIYAGNFRRYAGDRPRPVDLPAVLEHCRDLLDLARGAGADEETLTDMTAILQRLERAVQFQGARP